LKIAAIVSDYDGTICPTSSVYAQSNPIPEDLHSILLQISSKIPICILSSKSLDFLIPSYDFANIISSILGIEIIVFSKKNGRTQRKSLYRSLLEKDIKISYIHEKEKLRSNSFILEDLSKYLTNRFNDIKIEKKYTFEEHILAGLTFDYRHILKWENYKTNIEPILLNKINEYFAINSLSFDSLNIVTYESHPFIDIYGTKFNKGNALDKLRQLLTLNKNEKILYLGDSENDKPAFLKSDLSINIRSDSRINTELKTHYGLEFNELTNFLTRLYDLDFHFSNMLMMN
jgi:HAD superfamily hydrolase (TIGR01484 family)